MKIKQIGYNCEKKVTDFLCFFFERDEDVQITTVYTTKDDIGYCLCVTDYKGKPYYGEHIYKLNSLESKKYSKKYIECAVLKAIYTSVYQIKKIKLPWGVMCGVRPVKNIRTFAEDGYKKEEIKKIFSELYWVSEDKFNLAYDVYENEKDFIAKKNEKGIGIYIGIPFCPTRCSYCSFVSTDLRYSEKYKDAFVKKLVLEIKITGKIIKNTNSFIKSIYIGGGTPTSLEEYNLRKIFEAVNENFDLSKIKEYTLEAGRCDTITREKLVLAKQNGVDRISINPQTMKEETLKKINRPTSYDMILSAFSMAKEIGFDVINADLIAGLEGENVCDFEKSLDEIIKIEPQNITVHTLCKKRGSAMSLSDNKDDNSEDVKKMVALSQKVLKENGYLPYYMYRQKYMVANLENVGFSKEGFFSYYNINIMEENQTIIALGAGASSKIVKNEGIERIFNFKDPIEYINNFDEIVKRKKKTEKIIMENRF